MSTIAKGKVFRQDNIEMIEKQEPLIVSFSKLSTRFFSSWWVVLVHTLLVAVWFALGLKLELFMLWISLEAIFIWVVYLAASGRREEKRDHLDALQQIKIKEKMLDTLSNGEQHNQKLDRITKMLYELQEEIVKLKKTGAKN